MFMEIEVKAKKTVEAKLLKLYLKVCDQFTATLEDADGNEICDNGDDYVPGFMPGQHYGDYVILDIDINTGQVVNWKKPDADDLSAWVEKCQGKDE
jgi:hypothetical protein